MRDDPLDEAQWGQAVDAWLVSLRIQGLSDRWIRVLAGRLGDATRETGPTTPAQSRVSRLSYFIPCGFRLSFAFCRTSFTSSIYNLSVRPPIYLRLRIWLVGINSSK